MDDSKRDDLRSDDLRSDASQRDNSGRDDSRKDVHANVGFTISSTPDKTELVGPSPRKAIPQASFPFRMVLVSDLAPEQQIEDWKLPNHLHRVDRNKYTELFETLAPTVNAEIVDRSGNQPQKIAFSLSFSSLKDFSPAGIVANVPVFAGLWGIRKSAMDVASGKLTLDDFRGEIDRHGVDNNWSGKLINALDQPVSSGQVKSPESSSPPAGDNASLNHILDMVNMGGSDEDNHTPPPGSPGALVDSLAAVAGSQEPSMDTTALNRIVRDIEQHVMNQVDLILQTDAVRELEARWRALKFLVDHLNFRSEVILDVLSTGHDDLAEAVHYQIVIAEHENRSSAPASLLVFDRAFGHTSSDIEALTEIAEAAENIQTPAICSLSPLFWGNDSETDLATLPVIWQQLEQPEYIEWVKFTETTAATHLSLAYPPMLLRKPSEPLTDDAATTRKEERPLFGGAAVATAAIVARRFSETGWPTLTGGAGDHALSDLLMWPGGKTPSPLAAIYREEKNGELADSGITVLTGLPSRDQIQLYASPTVSKRKTFEDDATTEKVRALRSLGAQLFISRIVHFLITEQASLSDIDDLEQAREYLDTKLRSLLGIAGHPDAANYVGVLAVESGGGAAGPMLDVSVEAPRSILPDPVGFRARIPF